VRDEIFEIAIYRLDPDAWEAESDALVSDYESRYLAPLAEGDVEPSEDDRRRAHSLAVGLKSPRGWQYNDLIGWVRLRADSSGPVIKAYLWKVGNKNDEPRRAYRRGFTAFPFLDGGPGSKVFDEWIDDRRDDREIYDDLRSSLKWVVSASGPLRRRYIDLRIFDVVGPHIEWRRLLGLDPS
jgi:hypothetical protein